MEELVNALHQLQRDFLHKYGKNGWKGSIDAQVESLRARAAAGKAALAATAKADGLQTELDALLKDIDGRLPVQVGLVFVSRRIRVGEVVGSWCKTKGNSAKRELSKAEFKDEVFKLGVKVERELVTRKALGDLFDRYYYVHAALDSNVQAVARTRHARTPLPPSHAPILAYPIDQKLSHLADLDLSLVGSPALMRTTAGFSIWTRRRRHSGRGRTRPLRPIGSARPRSARYGGVRVWAHASFRLPSASRPRLLAAARPTRLEGTPATTFPHPRLSARRSDFRYRQRPSVGR